MARATSYVAEVQAREVEQIRNTASWPCDPVHMKTGFWIEGTRRFGFLFSADLTTIVLKDEAGSPSAKTETFDSVEELAHVWMGD